MIIDRLKQLTEKTNKPYEVRSDTGVDVTKAKPYYAVIEVRFGDRLFKKRMENIVKEKRYYMKYNFIEKNIGSFFKPVMEQDIKVSIEERYLDEMDTIILDFMTLGLLGLNEQNDGKFSLKGLSKLKHYFHNEVNCQLFAKEVERALNTFLESNYKEYQQLIE